MNIDTARIFIPSPTGFTRTSRTFGLNRLPAYEKAAYAEFKRFNALGVSFDDNSEFYSFYEILRAEYGMALSMPKVRPFVQYVDYVNSIGGGFSADNTKVIEHLRAHCNTLVITDAAELEFLKNAYLKCIGVVFRAAIKAR